MFAEFAVLLGGELVGPFADAIGVHVRPVCGNFTKFDEQCCFCCGDVGWTGCGGGSSDENLPRCGGGGNKDGDKFVGDG